MIASIPASYGGGRRSAAGQKTEVGPRADRTGRSRHSVVPEHSADRFLPRGRYPPTQIRPPRVCHPQYWTEPPFPPAPRYFHSEAVHSMRKAFLPHFWCRLNQANMNKLLKRLGFSPPQWRLPCKTSFGAAAPEMLLGEQRLALRASWLPAQKRGRTPDCRATAGLDLLERQFLLAA
jgi:hypothetical protein